MLHKFREEDLGRFIGHSPIDSILVIKMLEQKVQLYHDSTGKVFFKGRRGLSLLARLRQLREQNGGRTRTPIQPHEPQHGKLILQLREFTETRIERGHLTFQKDDKRDKGKELQ